MKEPKLGIPKAQMVTSGIMEFVFLCFLKKYDPFGEWPGWEV